MKYMLRLSGKETSCLEIINWDGRDFPHQCISYIKELADETEMFLCEKLMQK